MGVPDSRLTRETAYQRERLASSRTLFQSITERETSPVREHRQTEDRARYHHRLGLETSKYAYHQYLLGWFAGKFYREIERGHYWHNWLCNHTNTLVGGTAH